MRGRWCADPFHERARRADQSCRALHHERLMSPLHHERRRFS